jgi:hypothetical protein
MGETSGEQDHFNCFLLFKKKKRFLELQLYALTKIITKDREEYEPRRPSITCFQHHCIKLILVM